MGLRIRLIALILPFIYPFFLSFKVSMYYSFLRNCKLVFSNLAYTWRMRDYIAGLRFWLVSFVLPFLAVFFLSLFYVLKIYVTFSMELLKL